MVAAVGYGTCTCRIEPPATAHGCNAFAKPLSSVEMLRHLPADPAFIPFQPCCSRASLFPFVFTPVAHKLFNSSLPHKPLKPLCATSLFSHSVSLMPPLLAPFSHRPAKIKPFYCCPADQSVLPLLPPSHCYASDHFSEARDLSVCAQPSHPRLREMHVTCCFMSRRAAA